MKTLYLDMDGVLADFNRGAQKILGASDAERGQAIENDRWTADQWQQLIKNPNLYRTLPKTPQADQLVDVARKFRDNLGWRLRVLTAIPRANDVPEAFQDKILWIQEYYPDITVYFGPYSRDKARHCRPGDILVDDRRDNCLDWQKQGGHAIRVKADQQDLALKELESFYHKEQQLAAQQLRNFLTVTLGDD